MTWSLTRVLRDRDAGLYLAGVVVSGFGTSAMFLAGGVWVKELTGSDGLAALVTFAVWAPSLAGPLLGVLADRTRRRPLLVVLNLCLAALLLSLFTVDSAGRLWILFTVLLVYGASAVVADAAESALVVAAVDKELLGDFNGLRMAAQEGMKLVAPLAGAGLLAAYGGPSVALLDAVTFAAAAGLYLLLRVQEEPPRPRTATWWAGTAAGARHLWSRPALRGLVLAGGTTMLLASLGSATLYAVIDAIGRPPEFAGVLYAVQGVGSVVAGAASGPLLRRLGGRRFGAYGIALTAVATAARALPSEAVTLISNGAIGLGLPCVLIAAFTAVQRETPDALLGRVSATAGTLVFAPNALGLGLGAALVETVGLRVLLPSYGALGLVTAGVLLWPARRARAVREPA
ncbi:MFS transporter [Streptomyces sulfonofaciens]|uniref:MFS transporter n=1 Tax=Streptomyces sulfonofaciens TaxID=68272 RepID=A0A919FWK7_9ACTN|nr:MFS transporter [Streptomyces sulfonofaciens]GHH73731.1 MFS transporter [Streptomyces sulfonofaciens]